MAKGCRRGQVRVSGYTRKDGVRVAAHCAPDKGAPGKGPKTLPKPRKGSLGWKKADSDAKRHATLKQNAKQEGCGVTIKRLTLLRNITADAPTKAKAKRDANWLRRQGFCELKGKESGA